MNATENSSPLRPWGCSIQRLTQKTLTPGNGRERGAQNQTTTRYEAKNPAFRCQEVTDSTAKTGFYTALLSLIAGR